MLKFSAVLNLFGLLCIFFAISGGILGAFDYEIVINNSEMGVMDTGTAIMIGVIGLIALGTGFLLKKRGEKKEREQAGAGSRAGN